jgi:soluble lytic murein transglycosylase
MTDVELNLNLGTWYLRHVLDELDNQPLLASAAYNAGPRRAREWRTDAPMEGAIYAESIPLSETRDYVEKVMSSAVYYSQQFGLTVRSLKDRLGVIVPPQPNNEPALDEPL